MARVVCMVIYMLKDYRVLMVCWTNDFPEECWNGRYHLHMRNVDFSFLSFSFHTQHFIGQREEFETARDSILVWLTEMDLQLTNIEHFSECDVQAKIKQLKVRESWFFKSQRRYAEEGICRSFGKEHSKELFWEKKLLLDWKKIQKIQNVLKMKERTLPSDNYH